MQLGDRVAILSETSIEWVEADLGVLCAGAATVPIYPTLLPDSVGEILRDSGAKVVIASDPVQVSKLFHPGMGELPELTHIISIARVSRLDRPDEQGRLDVSIEDVVPPGTSAHTLESVLNTPVDEEALSARSEALGSDSLAAIYYTSGTAGEPKGVMLTHDNFVFETRSLAKHISLGSNDEQLLFLPLAHIVAKLTVMLQLRVGFVTSFAAGIDQASEDCQEVRPTFIVGVPRIFEKIQEAIERRPQERGEVQQRVFEWALGVGRQVSELRQRGETPGSLLSLQHRSAERLVFSRIKERLGGRVRFMISGAAPLSERTARLFHSLGLLILEGYGLTESTGASSLNVQDRYRFGTVGIALDGVEIKLADDGEILLRGRSITPGYWNAEAATARSFTEDGFLRTGDIGTVEDGFLRVTDRKKDLIITAGGKNIAPQRVEQRLCHSPYIERAVVLGDRRKFPVALLVVDGAEIDRFASGLGLRGGLTALLRNPKVSARLAAEVQKVNEGLPSFEQVKRFEVITGDLTIADGTLTPTGKVRRGPVARRYADLVDSLYEGVTADLDDIS